MSEVKTKINVLVRIPKTWYNEITKAVEPFAMTNVQDYIRKAIESRLKSEGRIK